MRSEKDIEQSLRQADLDIDINAQTDRAILSKLVERQQETAEAQLAVGETAMGPLGKRLAAAAAITVIAALLIRHHVAREPESVGIEQRTASTIEMATALSLENAFRRGGIEAVDEQSRRAFGTLREPLERPSIQGLLGEMDAMDMKAWR
ncbi:MAG: hypothetical protein ACYTAS_01035 [Planctomycetota bacterium]|jgi:hypothetical protein